MTETPRKYPRIEINYLYFGAFFIFLLLISWSCIYTKENLGSSRIFFYLYSFGQVLLETMFFIFSAWIVRRFFGKIWFHVFIGITFVCLIVHLLDFLMNRILDLSIWEVVNVFVLNESFANFLLLLEASGIPFWAWFCIFSLLVAIPLVGILVYKSTSLLTERKSLSLRMEWFFQTFLCIPCALFLWDFSTSNYIQPDEYTTLIKSLPWKFSFIEPKNVFISLQNPILEPKSETEFLAAIDQDQTRLNEKPNIYLFIIESLRDDFITKEVAPHLTEFKKYSPSFDLTLSNANGTHLSWFSIFHSQFSLYWNRLKNSGWNIGSPSLSLLKKWGYQIRLYSSAHLSYYGMEELIFGKNLHLLDSHQFFPHNPPIQAWEADTNALVKLQKDLQENPELQQGQVFIIFWDGTHFDYSWPKNAPPKFIPFAKDFAYFKAFNTENNVRLIKNRYRNAVHYMDSLFGHFINHLPRKEESIIAVMGDHGEEFFEQGHLFHGSQLSHQQMNVPLLFKFGSGEKEIPNTHLVSQIDVFPSILHYLSGKTVSFLEGESIFQKGKWPYVLISRFNAGLDPREFCIHNGKNKLIARFTNRHNTLGSHSLQIMSLRNCKDQSLHECKADYEEWVGSEFGPAFDRLFPSPQ